MQASLLPLLVNNYLTAKQDKKFIICSNYYAWLVADWSDFNSNIIIKYLIMLRPYTKYEQEKLTKFKEDDIQQEVKITHCITA